MKRILLLLLVACFLMPLAAALAESSNPSGLPIPRFISLRHGEVNMRTGPGVRYPIEWTYTVKGLPLEVTAEFDTWRKVRDVNGSEGWIHQSVLSGKRFAVVMDRAVQLYRDANYESAPVAVAEQNVVARLLECSRKWCYIDVSGFRGWVPKEQLWGMYPNELIE